MAEFDPFPLADKTVAGWNYFPPGPRWFAFLRITGDRLTRVAFLEGTDQTDLSFLRNAALPEGEKILLLVFGEQVDPEELRAVVRQGESPFEVYGDRIESVDVTYHPSSGTPDRVEALLTDPGVGEG